MPIGNKQLIINASDLGILQVIKLLFSILKYNLPTITLKRPSVKNGNKSFNLILILKILAIVLPQFITSIVRVTYVAVKTLPNKIQNTDKRLDILINIDSIITCLV